MAVCEYCLQEMQMHVGCKTQFVMIGDKVLKRLTDAFDEESGECHDCGAPHGQFHHPGCDAERCPNCNLQIISCDCDVTFLGLV